MLRKQVYQLIAGRVQALQTCRTRENNAWTDKHESALEAMAKSLLPSGAGCDAGTTIDVERSKPDRLVLVVSFHHMSEHGYYDGWTDHDVVVTPSLVQGFNLRITGPNHRGIKEHLRETFDYALSGYVEESYSEEKGYRYSTSSDPMVE